MAAKHAWKIKKNPRILIVTPEITYLPQGMGNMANTLKAKAGGLADVSASLVSSLYDLGADVHVALPHYRRMFHVDVGKLINEELRKYKSKLSDDKIHLAEDRIFYYRDAVYSDYELEDPAAALAFQREVINNIIPKVNPDMIHCNDWMTGLIPAYARRLGIPALCTLHNLHSQRVTLERIENTGIDAALFWQNLYYERPPFNYEETRTNNAVDFLASGIFASHFINTVSPTFLNEIVDGQHNFISNPIRHEIAAKKISGCADGILNAPDPKYNPAVDDLIPKKYGPENHLEGKKENKLKFQERLGLVVDENAPIFFWPSRLDPIQKGCDLFAQSLYHVVSKYWNDKLQVVIVANGSYQPVFHNIVRQHDFHERVAVCDFDEALSRHGFAASDFTLMPSLFEPCGLPQMIGAIYGSLPIINDTGGLHDTVSHLNVNKNKGNGFAFNVFDSQGLLWAIDEAMRFYKLAPNIKEKQISRIMADGIKRFNHSETAKKYFNIYEKMLNRPLIN